MLARLSHLHVLLLMELVGKAALGVSLCFKYWELRNGAGGVRKAKVVRYEKL